MKITFLVLLYDETNSNYTTCIFSNPKALNIYFCFDEQNHDLELKTCSAIDAHIFIFITP